MTSERHRFFGHKRIRAPSKLRATVFISCSKSSRVACFLASIKYYQIVASFATLLLALLFFLVLPAFGLGPPKREKIKATETRHSCIRLSPSHRAFLGYAYLGKKALR